jgi:hypothetical protein
MSKNLHQFHEGEWEESGKRQLKKVHPKEIRGEYDDDLPLNDARRENRELRKRLARRTRRNEKIGYDVCWPVALPRTI